MTRRAIAAAALGLLLLLGSGAGCGGGIDTGVSADAARQLDLQVAAVRQRAEAGDLGQASTLLTDLTTSVRSLHDQGQLSDAASARIMHAADLVRQQLTGATTTAPTTTEAPPPPTEAPAPPKGHERKRKGD